MDELSAWRHSYVDSRVICFPEYRKWVPQGRSGFLTVEPDITTGVLTLVGAGLFWVTRRYPMERTALVSALVFIALIVRLEPVLDQYKNYGPPFREFKETIPPEIRPRVCGWNLDQTTRAAFPLYGDWRVETIFLAIPTVW